MIDIDQAIAKVAENCFQLADVSTMLDQLAGHVLSTDVHSDVDSPPFDKSMMDGFAVRTEDVQAENTKLQIIGKVLAGSVFKGRVEAGQAVQIMTGAPVPQGTNAVVMVEQTTGNNEQVTIHTSVVPCQNIMTRASAMACGQSVMRSGDLIRRQDIGLLAEAGVADCQVIRRPTLAVIATGDELIDASFKPTGSQIRNSNGPMLSALAKPFCSGVINLGISADNPKLLTAKIKEGIRRDVLILSGGVSAGVADLVPGLLQEAGVTQVFHKVKIKPGKPVWFGKSEDDQGRKSLVFGLPGNPVGAMVGFRVFVVPALLRLAGRDPQSEYRQAKLANKHSQRIGRTTYWPCKLVRNGDSIEASPLDWKGSADLRTLNEADCFGVFDGKRGDFEAGEVIQIFPMA